MALNLNLTESEEILRRTAADFMRREAPKEVIQELQETDSGSTRELWAKMAELGWLGMIIPEKYGGAGNTHLCAGIVAEAMGAGPLPGPFFSSSILSSAVLLEAGSEEQKRRFLLGIATGENILTMALTEPAYSWQPGAVQTTARRSNGGFVLNGVKLFVPDAAAADHLIVAARTSTSTEAGGGISLFLVDAGTPGLSVRRLPGFLAGRSFEVKLDSVHLPAGSLLGAQDEGWLPLRRGAARSIPVLCAYKVGGCQAVFRMALEYSRSRVQFGMPIGRFQRVQDMIIEMVTHADAARWTTYEALWKVDTGQPAGDSVHLAKAVTSEAYFQCCTLAHQVFSGVSYSKEHPMSFHTRASRALYSLLGDPGHHRQLIARSLVAQ